jgi:hypothetical protein
MSEGAANVPGMDLEEEITPFIHTRVAIGEESFAEIVAGTIDHLDATGDPAVVKATARRIAEAEFAQHLAMQAGWDPITDSDRLTLAFTALDAAGIVARESFTCCQTCGHSEIGGEAPPGARGYTFYHQQDAEGAAAGGALFLAYGSFGAARDTDTGAEISAALTRQGLTVDWDGDVGRRIRVPMSWQRRRVGELAQVPPAGRQ